MNGITPSKSYEFVRFLVEVQSLVIRTVQSRLLKKIDFTVLFKEDAKRSDFRTIDFCSFLKIALLSERHNLMVSHLQ